MRPIYKICDRNEWQGAVMAGVYGGSEHDKRDGFIHFSTARQLPGTLAKHYAGRSGLLLIAVDTEKLGDTLKWEPARDGDLFPHLHASLPVSAVLWSKPIGLGDDGVHILPDGVEP